MVTIDPLRIHLPPFPTQQQMDTTIAVAHAGSGDLPDTFTQMSLPGGARCRLALLVAKMAAEHLLGPLQLAGGAAATLFEGRRIRRHVEMNEIGTSNVIATLGPNWEAAVLVAAEHDGAHRVHRADGTREALALRAIACHSRS